MEQEVKDTELTPAMERAKYPEYGTCGKCERPWNFVETHSTQCSETSGMCPLCEKCWEELKTPEARLPYYKSLWLDWHRWGKPPTIWKNIEKAVMDGL